MSTVNGTNNVFDQINKANQTATTTTSSSKSQQDSDMFMKLMIAQLRNQDPTKPTDTNEFMSQIANTSQVESMNNLTNAVEKMSQTMLTSQNALQASSMVGQVVTIATDKAQGNDKGEVAGYLQVPGKTKNIRLTVVDEKGTAVETVKLGAFDAGTKEFTWKGEGAELGANKKYTIKAEAETADGKYVDVNTLFSHKVESVTLARDGSGSVINTPVGSTAMSNIIRISA